jgi:CMP-2-keto-3-deoxyoctulosonic acid synthetase
MAYIHERTLSVDTPEDLRRVRDLMVDDALRLRYS